MGLPLNSENLFKCSYIVNLFLLDVLVDANRIGIIFISVFFTWNELEGGFASVKVATENSGEAALAKWCSQIEGKTNALLMDLQCVGTV